MTSSREDRPRKFRSPSLPYSKVFKKRPRGCISRLYAAKPAITSGEAVVLFVEGYALGNRPLHCSSRTAGFIIDEVESQVAAETGASAKLTVRVFRALDTPTTRCVLEVTAEQGACTCVVRVRARHQVS